MEPRTVSLRLNGPEAHNLRDEALDLLSQEPDSEAATTIVATLETVLHRADYQDRRTTYRFQAEHLAEIIRSLQQWMTECHGRRLHPKFARMTATLTAAIA